MNSWEARKLASSRLQVGGPSPAEYKLAILGTLLNWETPMQASPAKYNLAIPAECESAFPDQPGRVQGCDPGGHAHLCITLKMQKNFRWGQSPQAPTRFNEVKMQDLIESSGEAETVAIDAEASGIVVATSGAEIVRKVVPRAAAQNTPTAVAR